MVVKLHLPSTCILLILRSRFPCVESVPGKELTQAMGKC